MLSAPRSPASAIWIFSSAECRLRVARRMSWTTFSAVACHGFLAHRHSMVVSQKPSVAQSPRNVPSALTPDNQLTDTGR
jgi:hypothetical protein